MCERCVEVNSLVPIWLQYDEDDENDIEDEVVDKKLIEDDVVELILQHWCILFFLLKKQNSVHPLSSCLLQPDVSQKNDNWLLLPIVKNGFVYNLQYATDINGTSWNNVSNET